MAALPATCLKPLLRYKKCIYEISAKFILVRAFDTKECISRGTAQQIH